MSDYTCSKCGKPMRFNVPRLGPDGGFVHADNGQLLCIESLAKGALMNIVLYCCHWNKVESADKPSNETWNYQIAQPEAEKYIQEAIDKSIESLQQQLAESEKDRKYWHHHAIDSDEKLVSASSEIDALKQQLAEAKETVRNHEQLMIRVNERVQTIRFSEDRVYIYQPSNEEFDDLRKEIFILQQERDKLMALVVEKDKYLLHSEQVFTKYAEIHFLKGNIDKSDINKQEANLCRDVLSLTPSNLPRFVPEEKVKELAKAELIKFLREADWESYWDQVHKEVADKAEVYRQASVKSSTPESVELKEGE